MEAACSRYVHGMAILQSQAAAAPSLRPVDSSCGKSLLHTFPPLPSPQQDPQHGEPVEAVPAHGGADGGKGRHHLFLLLLPRLPRLLRLLLVAALLLLLCSATAACRAAGCGAGRCGGAAGLLCWCSLALQLGL